MKSYNKQEKKRKVNQRRNKMETKDMTNGKTSKVEKDVYAFFRDNEVKMNLSQSEIYEIMSRLHLEQEAYGFGTPNQLPMEIKAKFKKLLIELQQKEGAN